MSNREAFTEHRTICTRCNDWAIVHIDKAVLSVTPAPPCAVGAVLLEPDAVLLEPVTEPVTETSTASVETESAVPEPLDDTSEVVQEQDEGLPGYETRE